MKVGSLFSGIGGLDLGLERADMEIIWQSEIDPCASRVLAHHWPDVPNLGDITTIDWSTVERPDLICGGYPCQPFSYAGTRQGTNDPRHLWPHMRNAIRDLRPDYVLIENVPGHLSLGFDRVLADLAQLRFDAEWSLVPACAMGAPHARSRLFCLAYPTSDDGTQQVPRRQRETGHAPQPHQGTQRWGAEPRGGRGGPWSDWWLSEPAVARVAVGVPSRLVRAPLERLGNAVVPAVAEWVGRRIMERAA